MPRKKVPCPKCGKPKSAEALLCWPCHEPYERTKEHREKLSAVLQGVNTWSKGQKRSEKTKQKMRNAWTLEKREAAQKRGLENSLNQEWRDKIARSLSGKKNPNYQGKNNATPYAPGWGRLHKRLIRERDGNQCVQCGSTQNLDSHHKDGLKDNHDPDNVTTLCRKCHANDPVDSRNKKSVDVDCSRSS